MSAAERTIVVGGGIAGLLAARNHARAGRQVTLLEGEATTGGAIAERTVGGIRINIGAEAWSTSAGAVEALAAELGLAEHVHSPNTARGSRLVSAAGVHRAPPGSMFGIPGRPLSRQSRAVLGISGALRAWCDRLLPASSGLHEGVTVGEYVRHRMGVRVVDRLVAPLVGGVHSTDPYSLELASTLPRLPDAVRENGCLAAAVRSLRPAPSTRAPGAGTAVRSLAPTMADLPRALEKDLRQRGGTVLTDSPAVSVERSAEGVWTVTTPSGPVEAEHLVLACPPDTAASLLEGTAPALAQAIPSAPATPVRLVALVLEAPELDRAPSGTGALVSAGTPGIRAKALTHATAKWEHVRRAAGGKHVVRLSYGRPGEDLPEDDSHGPEGTEGSIIDLALRDASAILSTPLDRSTLRAATVVTWHRTMRQSGPGHRDALQAVDALLADIPGLELAGSWRDGTGIDAIVRAAAKAATVLDAPVPSASSSTTTTTPDLSASTGTTHPSPPSTTHSQEDRA